ncbi:MAG: LysR family transcriptional regulator [Phyllobacterium sp.]|uniref:LysR family transcriptional regulator n=1 Tax=Phyllobacterium sp. TaxID=1871046 RepID=UPI0030F1311E
MNWNDIRYFLAVARHGGLTGAAKQLGVSQSTVARRVETLEASLRTRFFERHTHGYHLTEDGREMLEKAIAIEGSMAEIADDLGERDVQPSGTVRIATIETLANQIIIPNFPALQNANPELQLGISINASLSRLPQREADVALRLCRPEQGPYVVKRVGGMSFGLYASSAYLERHPIARNATPITGHRLIMWGDPMAYTALPRAMRSWAGGGVATLVLDSVQAQLLAVKAGVGIGILPCVTADAEGELVRINPAHCQQDEDIWLIIPNDMRNAKRIRIVSEFLTQIVQQNQGILAGRSNRSKAA